MAKQGTALQASKKKLSKLIAAHESRLQALPHPQRQRHPGGTFYDYARFALVACGNAAMRRVIGELETAVAA